jgi:hypothetical protein
MPSENLFLLSVDRALELDDRANRVERIIGYSNGAVAGRLRQMAESMLIRLIPECRDRLRAEQKGTNQ